MTLLTLEHAQSKNQVVLVISIFFYQKRLLSQTVQPIELEKRDCHRTSPLPPELQTLFNILQCSGHVQSNNGVNLVEVSTILPKISCAP